VILIIKLNNSKRTQKNILSLYSIVKDR
jgi:hypothetical protein